MSENQVEGGAGPALAAHSKDASATGHTPASQATADATSPRAAAGRVASTVSDAASRVHDTVSGQAGQAANQAGEFVRTQPLLALAGFGLVCLLVGVLIGRQNPGQ
jgi:ElaB/YqjD/DUF883 family membrane-anchored ribosome-binding protein